DPRHDPRRRRARVWWFPGCRHAAPAGNERRERRRTQSHGTAGSRCPQPSGGRPMTLLRTLIDGEWHIHLLRVLLHFLWQGAAVAGITALLSVVFRNARANVRYNFFA